VVQKLALSKINFNKKIIPKICTILN
jgi:hypothetical protein